MRCLLRPFAFICANILLLINFSGSQSNGGSLSINASGGNFLLDGVPFRYVSGSIHYFRVHQTAWRDRLRKLRYAGCNAVQTYIEWSSHEKEPGVMDFKDNLDIAEFLKAAQDEGLHVILRPGPFIDAERDMGGLPYWLLREKPKMNLRSSDPDFLFFVDRWFTIMFDVIRPFLHQNGGPVIMIQVENEYGSYPACDFFYTSHLRNLTRKGLGDDVFLFSTDGSATSYLKCGKVPDVYATIDFGIVADVSIPLAAQRIFEPTGPLVNSEFYSGWLDHWGFAHSKVDTGPFIKTLDDMLAIGASVNIYMFHGGTSFGLTSGSNIDGGKFLVCPTSYDYNAPLTEAGDYTPKYRAIRKTIGKYLPVPPGPLPEPTPKYHYGDVVLFPIGNLFQMLEVLESTTSKQPLTFEALSVPNGIVVYQTQIPFLTADPSLLKVDEIHDRGYVFIDEELKGVVSREAKLNQLLIFGRPKQNLHIVAESQGRVCFGKEINDFKGITSSVTLGERELNNWKMTQIPLTNYSKLQETLSLVKQKFLVSGKQFHLEGGMLFYGGYFEVPFDKSHPRDTFLQLKGWSKGYAWVNDFLLGRYWPAVGPQMTLYIPSGVLKQGPNSILLFELEESPCAFENHQNSCSVTLVDSPDIDGPTPDWNF